MKRFLGSIPVQNRRPRNLIVPRSLKSKDAEGRNLLRRQRERLRGAGVRAALLRCCDACELPIHGRDHPGEGTRRRARGGGR